MPIKGIVDLSNSCEVEDGRLQNQRHKLFDIDSYIKTHDFKSIFELCKVQLQSNQVQHITKE